MNDRELLELAAKAAGHNFDYRGLYGVLPAVFSDDGKPTKWDPLIDDGDAFRLASALSLTVEFGNNVVTHPSEVMGDGTDPLAATRRAIVRAAAEIARATPPKNEG